MSPEQALKGTIMWYLKELGYLDREEGDKMEDESKILPDVQERVQGLVDYYSEDPEPKPFITQNAMRIPSGEYLVSNHRHDYKGAKGASGEYYAVDGGYDYIKRVGNFKQCEALSTHSDTPFLEAREKLLWGSYGKSGKEPLHHIRLKDMEEDHIANVIEYLNTHHVGSPVAKWRIEMMREELKYRKIKLIGE